jgi:hypothetical protein
VLREIGWPIELEWRRSGAVTLDIHYYLRLLSLLPAEQLRDFRLKLIAENEAAELAEKRARDSFHDIPDPSHPNR